MNKLSIALLYGGRSGEHEVSLRSAASVLNHLNREKYHIYLIGITKRGLWYLQKQQPADAEILGISEETSLMVTVMPGGGLIAEGKKLPIDVVLPILHGTFGEDGTLQGLLEMADLPYAGATVGGSYLGMDKDIAKIIWHHHDLPVVPFRTLREPETRNPGFSWENFAREMEESFSLPLFIKPSQAGSSVGVSMVRKREEVKKAALDALRFDNKILIEPAVNAREVECSVIGNSHPVSFPPGELKPSHEFYDYEAKYIDPDGAALVIPADIDRETSDKIQLLAEKAYSVLECRGMSRVDFFLDKETNEIFLNEINTIPGFTNISMFPLMCQAGGLPYPELLDKLIEYALEEHTNHENLCFSLN